jgi:hypothetical protein
MTALTWCHASAAVLLFFSLFLSGTNHEIAELGNLGGEEKIWREKISELRH